MSYYDATKKDTELTELGPSKLNICPPQFQCTSLNGTGLCTISHYDYTKKERIWNKLSLGFYKLNSFKPPRNKVRRTSRYNLRDQ